MLDNPDSVWSLTDMILLMLTASVFGLLFFILHRDRRYLKKSIKEVATPEQRRYLNLKTEDSPFAANLTPSDPAQPVKSASRRLLEDLNRS